MRKKIDNVKSIISLAKELEVKTIAEYVENEEILKFLQDIEIDYVQGFHIGKPSYDITVEMFESFVSLGTLQEHPLL